MNRSTITKIFTPFIARFKTSVAGILDKTRNIGIRKLCTGIFSVVVKLTLAVYAVIVACPLEYWRVSGGIDGSHVYGMNYAFAEGFKYGKDVVWTHGPYGFLNAPRPVGENLDIAFKVQIALLLLFIVLICYIALRKEQSIMNFLLFLPCIIVGQVVFHIESTYDYFITFLSLLSVSLALIEKRWLVFLFISIALASLNIFIKFTGGVAAMSSIVIFAIITLITDREKFKRALPLLLSTPLIVTTFYFMHNPSIPDMIDYFLRSMDVSMTYSLRYYEHSNPTELYYVLAIMTSYLILLSLLFLAKKKSFFVMLLLLAPLFISFKHGFGKQDEAHMRVFFTFNVLVVGIVAMFTDFKNNIKDYLKWTPALAIAIAISITFSAVISIKHYGSLDGELEGKLSGEQFQRRTERVKNWGFSVYDAVKASWEANNVNLLPDELRKLIGSSTVLIFPTELSLTYVNSLNTIPLFVLQHYLTGTSQLDMASSLKLEDDKKAPKFILVHNSGETGSDMAVATWRSIIKWYKEVCRNKEYLLLKRRTAHLFSAERFITKSEYKIGDVIEIPESNHPVIASIHVKTNLLGKIVQALYKIGLLRIQLISDDGAGQGAGVFDSLKNGIIINTSLNMENVFRFPGKKPESEIFPRYTSFRITGDNERYYNDAIYVKFYELTEITIDNDKLIFLDQAENGEN